MVSNVTFNNTSVESWRLVLFVEETGVPRENHRPVAGQTKFIPYVVLSTPRHEWVSNSQL